MGNFEAQFFAENVRAGKGDGETDAGVEEGVVVGIIMKIATKDVGVQAQIAENRFGYAALVIISARRADRQSQHHGVDSGQLRRTGQQQVFHRGSLENAVVRSVKEQIQRWNIARNSEARAPGRFVDHKSVMIEAQSRGDIPVAEVDLVLYVGGRLDIPACDRRIEIAAGYRDQTAMDP